MILPPARTRATPKVAIKLERLEDRSTPAVIFTQNFDTTAVGSLPTGWVSAIGTGSAPNWAVDTTSTPNPVADTGSNSVWVDDPGSASDKRLTSPTINIPNTPGAQLQFRHNYSFETNWDGGVVEIAIGAANIAAGTFTDIVAAGGTFAAGGYTHTLISNSGNPIGGRTAWSASSGGAFITSTINLPASAQGQPIQLRWRSGSDSSVSSLGWRVDTVQVGTPSFALFSGNNQSIRVSTAYAQPLTVQVLGAFGGPVSGATVTYTAVPGSGGASVTFPGGNTATTDATGTAGVNVTANGVAGALTVRATVTGLGTVTFNLTNLVNQAPTGVSAGGPYAVQTGQFVSFTATGSDPENDPLTYSWDLNGDGTFGDAVGKTVIRNTVQLASIGIANGFSTSNLKVKVTDSFGAATTSAGASFAFQNQVPVNASAGGPYTAVVGNPLTFTAAGSDPDGDPLKYQWDLNGDGVFGDAAGASVTLTAAELSALGITGGFSTSNLKVRVLDPFGSTDSAATTLAITLVPPVPPPPPPPPVKLTAVAAGPGGGPHVRVFNADGSDRFSFFAYDQGYTGGVVVSTGDVTGDGVDDIVTGTNAGGGPHVKVFDGVTGAEIRSFFAYDPGFLGGLKLAVGDVNGDGKADIITGVGAGGGPHVKVFDGASGAERVSFFAFDPGFTGGVTVAAGDVNGDGKADLVLGAGAGGGPNVRVYDGVTGALIRDFYAFSQSFTGGVNIAAADITRDGKAEIFIGMASGGSTISLRDGATGGEMMTKVLDGYVGGVRVALKDLVGTGVPSPVVATGPGQASLVQVLLANGDVFREFAPYDPAFLGGVSIG